MNTTNRISSISRIYTTMVKIKLSVSIDEKLCKKIKEHNDEHRSTKTGVIEMALEKFFNIKCKLTDKK